MVNDMITVFIISTCKYLTELHVIIAYYKRVSYAMVYIHDQSVEYIQFICSIDGTF